jgi:hypothetical protein
MNEGGAGHTVQSSKLQEKSMATEEQKEKERSIERY